MTEELLLNFIEIIDTINIVVHDLFPETQLRGSYIGQMKGMFYMSPIIASRVLWRNMYPNDTWTASNVQILQLVDIYLQNGLSWEGDKLLESNSAIIPNGLGP